METITNLIIRACKSKDPHTRLKSVYRRFYLMDLDGCDHLINILSQICEEYNLMSLTDYIYATMPYNRWLHDDSPYNDVRYSILFHRVRHAKTTEFEGYRIPARYRNKPKVKDVVV